MPQARHEWESKLGVRVADREELDANGRCGPYTRGRASMENLQGPSIVTMIRAGSSPMLLNQCSVSTRNVAVSPAFSVTVSCAVWTSSWPARIWNISRVPGLWAAKRLDVEPTGTV